MNIEYIKNNYKFESLTSNQDLTNFYSESNELNNFLKDDALKQQNEKLNLTKLIICDKKIIGFVSLLTDTIQLKNIRNNTAKQDIKSKLEDNQRRRNKNISAVKIGRFAIDKKYAHKGLGSFIFENILYNIKEMSENNVGFRFVIVESYASAYSFYIKHHFVNLEKDDKEIKNKLNKIIERDPERTFYLYQDLKF